MKKLFPEIPDVPQCVANWAVRIIERYFKTHRFTRAAELPEEAKVKLCRDLRDFFAFPKRSSIWDRIRLWRKEFWFKTQLWWKALGD